MATKSPRRKRLQGPHRRQLILEAAAQAFAKGGYEVQLRDIAAEAGVTKSVLYDHFPSKQQLYIELLQTHGRDLIAYATDIPTAGPLEQVARASIGAFFAFVEENRFAWRILFRDPPADPPISALFDRFQEEATEGILSLLRLAGDLDLRADVPAELAENVLARAIKAVQNELAAWWWDHPEVTREQVAELAFDVIWRGVARLVGEADSKADRAAVVSAEPCDEGMR